MSKLKLDVGADTSKSACCTCLGVQNAGIKISDPLVSRAFRRSLLTRALDSFLSSCVHLQNHVQRSRYQLYIRGGVGSDDSLFTVKKNDKFSCRTGVHLQDLINHFCYCYRYCYRYCCRYIKTLGGLVGRGSLGLHRNEICTLIYLSIYLGLAYVGMQVNGVVLPVIRSIYLCLAVLVAPTLLQTVAAML